MSKFGGGGAKCKICDKTAYPAETIQFEKVPYHIECFRCTTCNKKMEGAGKAAQYEEKLYCTGCFSKGGFAQKQKKVVWTKKEPVDGEPSVSKFGGGGNACTICQKTVYMAETLSFEKKVYHPDCFKCAIESCGKKMTASGAAAFEDQVFCKKCFQEHGYNRKQAMSAGTGSTKANAMASKFGGGGIKCPKCDKTVYPAEAVSYEKVAYHNDCFTCDTELGCGKKMSPAGAAQFEGTLFCTKCFTDKGYNRKQALSHKPSTGTTTNAMASKFGGGGTKCVVCDKTVYAAETLSFEKNAYHAECFTCKNCSNKMNVNAAEGKKQADGTVDVYCKKCWQELGMHMASNN